MRVPRLFHLPIACGVAIGSLLALTSVALATHPRPTTGTPYRIPLVVAYAPCPGGPSVHGGLGVPSCSPPALESAIITTAGAGPAPGGPAGSGFVNLRVICTNLQIPSCPAAGDQEDVTVDVSITDVRCSAAVPPVGCPGAGADYPFALALQLPIRLSDHWNSPPGPPTPPCAAPTGAPCTNATTVDFHMNIPFACTPDAMPGAPPGSACALTTSLDGVVPGLVTELQRQIYRTWDEVVLRDPGPDGTVPPACFPIAPPGCGTGDEGITHAEGWFAP